MAELSKKRYYDNITSVVITDLYDYVIKNLKVHEREYKNNIGNFFNRNHSAIYDVGPYDNIYFTTSDIRALFTSLDINEAEVKRIMKSCYWNRSANIVVNPQLVKEPYVEVIMAIIIYYLKNKKDKEAELSLIYLAFTGKFYASNYARFFHKNPPSKYRSTMDYVVNNMLNDKYDLRTTGSVFGAIRVLCLTLLDSYKDDLINNPDDDQIRYFLGQLRDREFAFLRKISNLYYNAYENKYYLNFESDNLADGSEFRITDSDATIASRITENAVNYMITNNVDLGICKGFRDSNLKPTELRDIIEAIVSDKTNINQLHRVCNILICDFIRKNPGIRIDNVEFINYSLKEQSNTKDKYIIEMQTTIMGWLDDKSENYRRRKSRKATAISYRKSVKYYIIMIISRVAAKSN
jgi:hypothetical protein